MPVRKQNKKPGRSGVTEQIKLIMLTPLGMHERLPVLSESTDSADSPDSAVSSNSTNSTNSTVSPISTVSSNRPVPPSPASTGPPDQSNQLKTSYCPICREMVHCFCDHITSYFKPTPLIRSGQPASAMCARLRNVLVTLYKDNELRLRNWSGQPLLIQAVYLISPFDACCLTAGQALPELQPKEDCVFQWRPELESKYSATTICVLTEMPDGTEYIEWHQLLGCCPSTRQPEEQQRKHPVQTMPVNSEILSVCSESNAKRDAFAMQLRASFGPDGLTIDNYLMFWTLADQLERAEAQLPLEGYKLLMMWQDCNAPGAFTLQIPSNQLSDEAPCFLTRYDTAVFSVKKGVVPAGYRSVKCGTISAVTSEGSVTVELMGENPSLPKGLLYEVTFVANTYPADMQLGALQCMSKCGVLPLLFGQPATRPRPDPCDADARAALNSPVDKSNRGDLHPDADFEWFFADLNARQQAAVRRIVAGDAYPHPYVLFGPPGTGKTKTLAEAILQLWRRAPNSRMLVCAATNAAADELALRLAPFVTNQCHFGHNLYRLYSQSCLSRDPSKDMPQLEEYSNYPEFQMPTWKYLQQFRIVVCTLVVAGSFRYMSDVRARDFSHVIVDESGSSTELAALLPMAVCTDLAGLHARVVLAGDPKQLGPVIKSRSAVRLGAGVSLLERLMLLPAYNKLPTTKAYNPRFITKLINNYRSHPTIMSLANRAFYDSELRASGARSRTHRFTKWWRLPVTNTPIIFHSVSGCTERERGSTSLYNRDEIEVLVEYIDHLMAGDGVSSPLTHPRVEQSDIGVISPYALQCTKIREALQAIGYPDIMVAPVESFQGRERPIILTSTVRSAHSMPGLGFLGCAKRLNVMITRPQSLLIMIGDALTLRLDRSWRLVLRRFLEMGVCVGERFHVWRLGEEPPQRERPLGDVSELAKQIAGFSLRLPHGLPPPKTSKKEQLAAELLQQQTDMLSKRDERAHRVLAEPQRLVSAEVRAKLMAHAERLQRAEKERARREAMNGQRNSEPAGCVIGSSIEEFVARQLIAPDDDADGAALSSSGTSSLASGSQATSLDSLSSSLESELHTSSMDHRTPHSVASQSSSTHSSESLMAIPSAQSRNDSPISSMSMDGSSPQTQESPLRFPTPQLPSVNWSDTTISSAQSVASSMGTPTQHQCPVISRPDSSSPLSMVSQNSAPYDDGCEYALSAAGIPVCRHCNQQYWTEDEVEEACNASFQPDAFADLAEQFVAALPH